MRMRDKPTVAVEMSIAASPARVWELVTDLQLMGHWSPEYQVGSGSTEQLAPWWAPVSKAATNAGEGSGSRSRPCSKLHQVGPLCGLWAILPTPPPPGVWTSRPTAVGRVCQHVQLGPGPSGLTARIAELPDREEDIIAARTAELRTEHADNARRPQSCR